MRKVLVANRGEIAVRIIRACRDLGIPSVAVYSECDRAARHVRMADEAVGIGPSPPAESYLRVDAIVDAARRAAADAVHPGYGFLSENGDFADACEQAGLIFVGPPARVLRTMGSKTGARRVALEAGVPIVPGIHEPIPVDAPIDDIRVLAAGVGYPLLVKAVEGGGGKGMRTVSEEADLPRSVRAARSEALTAFGDAAIYLERQIMRPRHIEVQVLADASGTVVPFVERECSVQRRHQKVVEETPSMAVTGALRQALARAAAAIASAAGYTNAGTVEFLLDQRDAFYFLEMNARLQVEHPITEAVTGVDLVRWQLRLARGERLDLDPMVALSPRGHAIECRIYAEDPDTGFLPCPGRVTHLRVPDGPGIRDDGSVEAGAEVPVFYDPLVSKLIAWGADRQEALARMRRALREYEVRGIRTTVPFFRWILAQADFERAAVDTGYLDEVLQRRQGMSFEEPDSSLQEVAAIAAALRTEIGPGTGQCLDSSGVARGRAGTEAPARAGTWKSVARAEALRT